LSSLLRVARYAPLDALDHLTRRRDPALPPRRLALVGDGDFTRVGEEHVSLLVDLGGLEPDADVLDIGCGIGRMAIPLSHVLDAEASYVGFDANASMVRWCRSHIATRHRKFAFHWADIANDQYNPDGRLDAARYTFPCQSGSIDFAFATSVFTHLLPDATRRYIAETARVLRSGGRCLFTFFLITPESLARLDAGSGDRTFPFDHGEHHTEHPTRHEIAVAYPEDWIRAQLESNGLRVRGPVHPGSWSGATGAVSYQDILVAERCDG
jgi:SAM-dependent methyltransferase